MPAERPAVFFDRDGTLIEEVHYCSAPSQVRAIKGAPEALMKLSDAGFALVIISRGDFCGLELPKHFLVHTIVIVVREVSASDAALIGDNDEGEARFGQFEQRLGRTLDGPDLRRGGAIMNLLDEGAVPIKEHGGALSRHDFESWREVRLA